MNLNDVVRADEAWPEVVYVEPGGRYMAILTAERLDYRELDWRQRAFIRAAATNVLARLDATEPGEANGG